jgi:outer membrane lipase/esterase
MFTRQTRGLVALVGLLLIQSLAPAAYAHDRERLVFFGDSLTDPGNHFIAYREVSTRPFEPVPSAPYAIGGFHFSNGSTWAEQLAWQMGTPASGLPALLAPRVFTNYAVGRARARAGAPVFPDFDLSTQVGKFLVDFGGQAPAGATYAVWMGANDLNDALGALFIDPSGATSAGIIQSAVAAVAGNIQALWLAGARDFLVPNLPDLAITPAVRALGPQAQGAATVLKQGFNGGLAQALGQLAQLPGIRIIPIDVDGLLVQVIADPAAWGLANASDACLTFGVVHNPFCRTPNRYLFWDGIHPTRAGHAILAREAADILSAP